MEQVYADKNKITGVGYKNSINVEAIYQRYLQAFKKGVYNYIKEEQDSVTQQIVPRKYFSGGVNETDLSLKLKTVDSLDNAQMAEIKGLQKSLRVTIDMAMSAQPNPAMENPEPSPGNINFKNMIEKDVISQFPQASEEERRLYAPDRVIVSVPDSVAFHSSVEDDPENYFFNLVLREMLLNALNAQQTGRVEISFKDNVIYFKNKGNLFARMWGGYHLLLNKHLLWVSHNPVDGSIIEFTHEESLPQPGSYKEGSERYNTAVKELALYREATEAEIDNLFKTSEGRNLLFFSRRNISFSGVEGTKGFGIDAINGVSNSIGGKLLLVDDGENSGEVVMAVKFSRESLITFVDQAMNSQMHNDLIRLAYHDKDYRRGAVDRLFRQLNEENIYQWAPGIISNFIDPVGIGEAQEFYTEKQMPGEFNAETARRNARWASIFALKFDVFKLFGSQEGLKQRFQEWITQRIRQEITAWLGSNHLNSNSPEIISGTKDEIELIKAHHLGHEGAVFPKQFAFLENIRLIYLAAQMKRRREIKEYTIEPYVFSSIENVILSGQLSQTEIAVLFPGIDQAELLGNESVPINEVWDQLRANLDKYKAVFSDPSVAVYYEELIGHVISIGKASRIDLEDARLQALETNGSFEDGYVDEKGRLIRDNGPTIKKMKDQHIEPPQVKGKQFEEALAAKFDEEFKEAWEDGAKADNQAELKRHLVNLLQVAMTVKNMTQSGDQAMTSQPKPMISVSRGITIETVPHVSAMSSRVARSMADTLLVNNISGKPTVFICPTGGTQDGIYAKFVNIIEQEHIDFTNLHTFNMDEYYVGSRYQGVWGEDPRSYRHYMEKHLFSQLRALNPNWNADNSRVHFLNGQAPDIGMEIVRYEEEFQHMRDTAGIDLEIGGIGRDGHIAFNEPIIIDNDSLLLDVKKVIDFNEFWIKGEKSSWPKAVHGLLFRHWISREEPTITNYLENEFFKAGIVAKLENIHLLARKLIWQKVTIYLDGLQPADTEKLKNEVSGLIRDFHLHNFSVEFRDSSTIFNSRTRAVQLSIPTIIDNSRFFKSLDEIPLTALTIGLGTVLDAKKIIIAATGPAKQEAVYSAVAEPESSEVSASSLQRHKNVTFVVDSAAGELYRESGAGKMVRAAGQTSAQVSGQVSDQAMNSVRIADNVDNADFDDVWRQIQAINKTVSTDYYHPNKESEQLMRDSLKHTDPNFKYALAMDASGRKILGYVFFDTLMRYSKIVYISNIAVLPEYQGKHIGIQLIKHVLEYANQLGHLPVQLNTASSQNPALDFYDKLPANIPGVTMESTGFEGKAYYELTYNPLTQKQIEDQLLQSSRRHFKSEGAKQLWLDLKMDKDRAPGELPAKLQGKTQNEIALLYNISPGKVSALLVGAGIFNTGRKLKGGIDLTPANMDLQTQNAGGAIKFNLDPAMLAQLQNAKGFVPVIINIQPVADLPRFLGINSPEIAHT